MVSEMESGQHAPNRCLQAWPFRMGGFCGWSGAGISVRSEALIHFEPGCNVITTQRNGLDGTPLMDLHRERVSVRATILILIGFATIIHLPFHIGSLYGEQDAARLVNDALIWSKAGLRTELLSEYRFYISPAYIWLVKQLLFVADSQSVHPAFYLNTLNLLGAILIVIPTFFFFKRLVSHQSAFLATLFLSVVPTFWQAGSYGFPHLLSTLPMICAFLVYDHYLAAQTPKVMSLILITGLLTASVLLKADIYLSTIVFLGLIIYRRRLSWRYLLIICAVVSVPVVTSVAVSESLLKNSPSMVEYMANWNQEYVPHAAQFFSRDGIKGVTMSMGIVSIPVFIVGLVLLAKRKQLRLALLLLLWLAVPLSVWIFRTGDSARHHFQSSFPIALGLGVVLDSVSWRTRWRYISVLCLILANYFYFAPSSSTVRTSGNLFQSIEMTKERVAQYHQAAKSYADAEGDRKVVLGSITNPYVDNEILRRAETVDSVRRYDPLGFDSVEIRYTLHGRMHTSASVRANPQTCGSEALAYKRAGYRVFSMEYNLSSCEEQNKNVLNEF